MLNIINLIKSLPNLLRANPATTSQIIAAETELNLCFSDEYKKYLSTFGAIIAHGIELSGISKADHQNVITLTKREWELNPKVPLSMYVVENPCIDGIIIWQNADGKIYQSRPGKGPIQIANSLAEYITSRF